MFFWNSLAFSEYSGLFSFRIDWFDLLVVQGTLKSLLQHHSSKASILQCSALRKLSAEELMLLNAVVLEKTLESPLDYKEIKPVHPKEEQSWIFIGRTDAEAATPILWPPDAKS